MKTFTLLIKVLKIFTISLFIGLPMHAQNFVSMGLIGENVTNPTSIQFGPDGKLYVSEQSGSIHVYTITRTNAGEYRVTDSDIITVINDIPNHDDNGQLNTSVTKRQVTGILVTGTAENPVIYVTSSDSRIGGGGGGSDTNLDTNSGIISKLTRKGDSWERTDLVRGLPRSEENHSTNGLIFDKASNMLYVCSGGNTNAGSPSNNFALITEYAYSNAILTVDLNALASMPVQTEKVNGLSHKYVYDFPTLDDPTRDNANGINSPNSMGYDGKDKHDPFGGNDGLNQAKYVPGGPVQIFATGFRNIYDIVMMENGKIYTWDNGANGGWGGYPEYEGTDSVTNNYVPGEPGSSTAGENDAKVNNLDGLHFVSEKGYYGGHPNPVRANPAGAGLFTHDHNDGSEWYNGVFRISYTGNPDNTLPYDWPPYPEELANPVEADFQNAGVDDLSLYTVPASTNGVTEYTASNFNNSLKGNLLAASFNGNIYNVKLNQSGTIDSEDDVSILASGFGSVPLDVTAQGDDDIFPGTIWAATYGSSNITIFEPADFNDCQGTHSAEIDEDQDGYSNADELDNDSDPCNAASTPPDHDHTYIGHYLVSDMNDPDDDDDGIEDSKDIYPLDPDNGLSTQLPVDYPLLNNDPGFGFYGLGFTGLMIDGTTDYLSLIEDEDNSNVEIIAGGAVGLFTMNNTGNGDAFENHNNQKNAFHFGADVNQGSSPFRYKASLLGEFFLSPPEEYQSAGIYIGSGDQSSFLKWEIAAESNHAVLRLTSENNDTSLQVTHHQEGLESWGSLVLFLDVNPYHESVTPGYIHPNGDTTSLDEYFIPEGDLHNALHSSDTALAFGIISTSRGTGTTFNATWDNLEINYLPVQDTGRWNTITSGESCQPMGSPQSCPQGRHEASFVQSGDKFYLMGGREHGSNVNIYDYKTDTWTTGSTPPLLLHHYQAIEHQGLIYVMGAFTGTYPDENPVHHIYIYNPATDTWHKGDSIPRSRGSTGAFVYNEKIYLVSGLTNGHIDGHVKWFDVYDPATGQWQQLPDAPHARDHFHAIVHNDKLYLAGGRRSNYGGPHGTFSDTEEEVDVYNFETNKWTTTSSPIPTPRAGNTIAGIGNEIIVIGGESIHQPEAHNQTEAYHVHKNEWRNLASLNTGRHGTQAIVSNNGIYIAAGSPKRGGGQLKSVESFHMFGKTEPEGKELHASILQVENELFFNNVKIDHTHDTSLTLYNKQGNQAILINKVTLQGDTEFSIEWPQDNHLILPGDSLTLKVTYHPASTEPHNATIVIDHTADTSVAEIHLASSPVEYSKPLIMINSGGPALDIAGESWTADQHYTGGSTYTTSLDIASTTEDQIYQSERWGTFSYNIPLSNGSYKVELLFAEIYFVEGANGNEGPGNRVFSVYAENSSVLTNYDINDITGTNTPYALTETFVTDVSDGELNIDFSASVNNAKVSGIKIYEKVTEEENTAPVASLTATPQEGVVPLDVHFRALNSEDPDGTISYYKWYFGDDHESSGIESWHTYENPGEYIATLVVTDNDGSSDSAQVHIIANDTTIETSGILMSINAGGPELTLDGKVWSADQYYAGGGTYSTSYSIKNTEADQIYQTERYGDAEYDIPVENGEYVVELHFAEIYLTGSRYEIGARIFDVWIEEEEVISDLDINKETGSSLPFALIKSYTIQVADGVLDIDFVSNTENAKISGIRIKNTTARKVPEAIITTNTTSGYAPLTVEFNATSSYDPDGSIMQYEWKYGDGFINPGSTTSHTYDSASIYTATLTVTDDHGLVDSTSVEIHVSSEPTPQPPVAAFTFNPESGQIPLEVTFDASQSTDQDGEIMKYTWDFGNGSGGNSQIVQHTYSDTGSFVAQLIITDNDGLTDTIQDIVQTYAIQSNPSELLSINSGGQAIFTDNEEWSADDYYSGGGTYNTSYSIANTESDPIYQSERYGNSHYKIPVSSGEYLVELHFAEIWFTGSRFGVGERIFNVLIENNEVISELDINSETGSTYPFALVKSFDVRVEDDMLDIELISLVENAKISGIRVYTYTADKKGALIDVLNPDDNKLKENENFILYPNPFKDQFTLKATDLTEASGVHTLNVYNLSGKKIHSRKWHLDYANQSVKINLSDQPTGYYYLWIKAPQGEVNRLPVIKK